jgi:sulfur carrier protein ThiS
MGGMHVRVSFNAFLRPAGIKSGDIVEVAEGTTVTQLMSRLEIRPDHHRFVRPMINGEEQNIHTVLKPNDDIMLLLPIGGG